MSFKKFDPKLLTKDIIEIANQPGHWPHTRRDFMGLGLIPFSASVFLPSIGDILFKNNIAHAQDAEGCPGSGASTGGRRFCSFVNINLAGGGGLSANMVAMDKGGLPVATYDKMGLGRLPNITQMFANGTNMATVSTERTAIAAAATAATIANTVAFPILVQSRDDTGANALDITSRIASILRGGIYGQTLTQGALRNTSIGPRITPQQVGTFNDLLGALGPSGVFANFSVPQKNKLLQMVDDLSMEQRAALMGKNGGELLGKLATCAIDKNVALTSSTPAGLDPRTDAAVAPIWGLQAGTAPTAVNMIQASLIYNSLGGNAGPVNIELGGYDYHNNTRTRGDTADAVVGTLVGRILQTAAVMNQPVFVTVTSDGSVTSPVSDSETAPWRSDRGSAGQTQVFFYKPGATPPTTANGAKQIGSWTNDQSADTTNGFGNNPALSGYIVLANYLAANGQLAMFNEVAGNQPLSVNDIAIIR